jgi:NodT family efflux transporter outer membrane factor (OMF) lipoprotein
MSTSASKSRAAAAVLAVVLCSACSLAPKYSKHDVPSPAAFKELPSGTSPDGTVWKPAEPGDSRARGKWWELFGDAALNEFEERIDSSNQNVAAAAEAFLAARAQVAQARSQFFPTLGTSPGATRSRIGATPYGVSANSSFTEYTLPFDASWQPDFWGKTRNAVAASAFAAQASAADLENVRLTAHAELAVDYYQLRAQDALEVLLDSAAASDQEAVSLARTLNTAGLDSDQALAQAQVQLETARAQAANARLLRAQYEHAIATLLGVSASAFSIPPQPFTAPAPAFPAGIPSQLLERRPDIAAAERAVASANAEIGVARAAYFPSVTLSASAGFESFSPATWLSWSSRFWSIGANANETLFDGGLRGAVVRQAVAVRDQQAAAYRQTVLSAFQQVEDGLASVRVSADDVRSQDAAVEAARRNLAEESARYQAGLDPYLAVVADQTALVALEQTALAYRIQRVTASVGLIEALGGGWDESSLPEPKNIR